jgi:hypothetical protein
MELMRKRGLSEEDAKTLREIKAWCDEPIKVKNLEDKV